MGHALVRPDHLGTPVSGATTSDRLLDVLVGKSVVSADVETGTLVLSDGTRVEFDLTVNDCCSWVDLAALRTTPNVITAATLEDDEDETGGEGPYRAWLRVVTEAGELNIAEADGDATNGYYLHGFALGVRILPLEEDHDV